VFGSQTLGRARFRELAGPAAEGVCFPLLFTADTGDLRYSRFASRFGAERGQAPDYTAVLTYDTTCLLIEAIRQAGPNRARIREALIGLSPWPGLAGPIHFDGTGQNIRTSIRMDTIQDGRIVSLPRDSCPNTATTDRTAKL
jgi:branched-chain amino acid transport system substrate-binding protein